MSHDLELERDGAGLGTGMEVTFRQPEGMTRITIVQGGSLVAGLRDQFARGRASIRYRLGRGVAARVTDRS